MTENNSTYQSQLNRLGVSLHSAILRQLIGQVESAIADGRIRSQDGQHSVYDFIRVILGQGNPSSAWKRFTEADSSVIASCYNCKFPGERQKETPVMDLVGLVYVAYMGRSEFSQCLRRSSAVRTAEEFATSQTATSDPIASLERSFAASEKARIEVNEALDRFPNTLDRLHSTSGIVNKTQVKQAVTRGFVEGRDYIFADGRLTMNDSTFNILIMSFRSLAGTDLSDLPRTITVETERYFQHQQQKRMNRRIGQREDSLDQICLFDDLT